MATVHVEIDTTLYRLVAVQKAAYRFGARAHVQLEWVSRPQTLRAVLKPRQSVENLERLADEFREEVLDQELREVVADETKGVRNLLLAQAFSATSLILPDLDTADFHDDPLKIAVADVAGDARPGSGEPGS